MLSVKVEGIAQTNEVMDRVQARVRDPKIPRVWRNLLVDLRTYPPPPPNSKYIRTGHLARSWRVGFAQGNKMPTLFEAANDATYARYVVGDPDEQALIHQGRWTPASVILLRYQDDIVREWEGSIEDAAK